MIFGTSDVKSLNISLYDADNNQIGETRTIYNSTDNLTLFDGLTNNTTYNVKSRFCCL
ncbi:MAG: hypothetical protein L6V91_09605 [Bacilli bacterium]|nr:MAG: hypothetical protein L6V91_09605 [Bacilli bacterium]